MSDLENFEKYCQENNYEQVEKYATQISKGLISFLNKII